MAPHSSTLAWKTPWTEEPGRLQSMGSLRVGLDWVTWLLLFTFMHWRGKWQPTPVFLPGESQGRGSLLGCRLWGRRVGHDWGDLAAAAANRWLRAASSSFVFLNFVKIFFQNIFHQEVGWILQCGTSGYEGPTVLPLQLFKVKHPIPLCPLAAVRIKGVGDGKETGNFSIICNFRNRFQEITLNFSRELELYEKMRFQDTLADLNDPHLPKLLFDITFISLGYSL